MRKIFFFLLVTLFSGSLAMVGCETIDGGEAGGYICKISEDVYWSLGSSYPNADSFCSNAGGTRVAFIPTNISFCKTTTGAGGYSHSVYVKASSTDPCHGEFIPNIINFADQQDEFTE